MRNRRKHYRKRRDPNGAPKPHRQLGPARQFIAAHSAAAGPFYVYRLIDPRDGEPFYIGKGHGERAWEHERDVIRGYGGPNFAKVTRIKAILAAGRHVKVDIVAQFRRERDALEAERKLVEENPNVTNVAPGGVGKCTTPASFVRARRGHLLAASQNERHEHEIRTWMAGIFKRPSI